MVSNPIRIPEPSGPRPDPYVTFEEFLDRYDEDRRAEWVDGEVIYHMPPESLHQIVVALVRVIVGWYGRRHRLGAVNHDFVMRIGNVSRVPDVAFVLGITQDELPKTFLPRAVDLAVEVVSPESKVRDRVTKRREYQSFGVREYWLADLIDNRPRFFQQIDAETLAEVFPDSDGIYESSVLTGLRFPADWLIHPVLEEAALEWLRLAVPWETYEAERRRAETERRRAEAERRRADRLARRLRELGIDPDSLH